MLPSLTVDLATMTGNAAQAIVDDLDWAATLAGIHDALRPDGHLVFETRDPAREAWREWTRATTHEIAEVDGVGRVEHWGDLVDVSLPLVTFRWTLRLRGRRDPDVRLDAPVPRTRRGRVDAGSEWLCRGGRSRRPRSARARVRIRGATPVRA
jgi:hypothetical protein